MTTHAASHAATHAEWLDAASHDAGAPPALAARVHELLATHPEWMALARPEAFVAASEALLRRVLEQGAAPRSSALDLLAADACVTWAFEAAATESATIAARAERAASGIAAVAAEFA